MISKLVVRSVLVALVVLISRTVWLTWSASTNMNTAQRATLIIIESGVLLAALSLLIESFRSFGHISMSRKSFQYVFSGLSNFDLDENGEEKKDVATVRTCELFAMRSILLAFAGLTTAGFASVLWEIGKFLLNPHALIINWGKIGEMVAMIFGGSVIAILLLAGYEFLHKKLEGKKRAVQAVVKGSYWLVFVSIALGVLMAVGGRYFKEIAGMPLYLAIFYFSGLSFMFLSGLGAIFAIGYGLFRLAGKAILSLSKRHPVLGEAWNQICPLQTIHFK